jgi:DNA-binding NarL/FixJ family response regulator
VAVAPRIDMPIPVICLEKQPDVWTLARLALEGEGAYVLVNCPAALDQIVSLSSRIGPAILLTNPAFIESLESHEIRKLCLFSTLYVLVVTSLNADDPAIEGYLREGCSGILNLYDGPDIWRKAMQSVAAGELWVSRQIATRVFRALLLLEEPNKSRQLTPREAEILELIGSGYSNRDIARQLFITKETVRWHLRTLYSKVGAPDRASAIKFATKLGHSPESDSFPPQAETKNPRSKD